MASKTVSKSVVWQLAGSFLLQGISFFTTPIFTRLLNPSDYGITALYNSWVSFVTIFIGLSIEGSINNARIKYENKNIYEYLSSILGISILAFLFFLFLSISFNGFFSKILNLRKDLVVLIMLQSFSSFLLCLLITKLNTFKQVEKSAIISFVTCVISISMQLFFVIHANENKAYARIYGAAISSFIVGLIVLFLVYFKGKCLWNKEYNKFCMVLTLPLVAHSISGFIFNQSDRVMIQRMVGDTELGIYSVSCTLCSVISTIFFAFNNSWVPFYYDYKKNNDNHSIIEHSRRYIRLISLVFIGFMLLAYDVFKLMAPVDYWYGIKLIPIFTLSLFFTYMYLFPVNFEFYLCKTKIIPICSFMSAFINIVINFILIPRLGIIGAAIGTLISHICLFLFHLVTSRFIIKEVFEYPVRMLGLWILIMMIMTVVIYNLRSLYIPRYLGAVCIGIYLLIDIKKHRSLF